MEQLQANMTQIEKDENNNSVGRFKIPEFKSKFEHKMSPFINCKEEKEWLKELFEFSAMSREAYAKTVGAKLFGPLFYPFCQDFEKYEILQKYFLLLYVLDDHSDIKNDPDLDIARDVEKTKTIWGTMSDVFHKIIEKDRFISMNKWRPYVVYNYILAETICAKLNDHQKRRFRDTSFLCYKGLQEENGYTSKGSIAPTYEENLRIRKQSSGCTIIYMLMEYAENFFITEEEYQNPLFQKFMDLATEAICIDNDILSFEKEFFEANSKLNWMCLNTVMVTARLDGCDVETAMKTMVNKLAKVEEECLQISNQLLSDASTADGLKVMVNRIGYVIGGNDYLTRYGPRFTGKYT